MNISEGAQQAQTIVLVSWLEKQAQLINLYLCIWWHAFPFPWKWDSYFNRLCVCVCVCVYLILGCTVSLSLHRLSLVEGAGDTLYLWCEAFLQWLLSSQSTGSRRMDFSSCGAWASLFQRMWNLPGPGTEPVFSALAGRPLSNVPSGKSLY